MTRRLEAMGQKDYAGLTTKKHFNGVVRTLEHKLDAPLHWRKPRMVFVNSMSDLFHKNVPFEFIVATLGVISAAPLHTFQILTKRPERMAEVGAALSRAGGLGAYIRSDEGRNSLRGLFDAVASTEEIHGKTSRTMKDPWMQVMNAASFNCWPLSNCWLGTSVENQAAADERLPHLRRCPAAVRFLSVEPMLGPINFRFAPMIAGVRDSHFAWCIFGCESGPKRRPCELDWIRDGIRQCRVACIAPFVKQIPVNGGVSHDPEEWPEDLRIREFPAAQHEAPRTGREEV
jgi:protein gp37